MGQCEQWEAAGRILCSGVRRRRLPAVRALSEKKLRAAGYFNPHAVERMLDLHRREEGDYDEQMTAVLAVQLKFAR